MIDSAQHPFRPCILAASFNNDQTLRQLLDDLEACRNDAGTPIPLIVVNDGSTDTTAVQLSEWTNQNPECRHVLTHPTNRGKAAALRTGFEYAAKHEFTHALTIDTDGQHAVTDVPSLLTTAGEQPRSLVLGVRQGGASAAPGRHRLGRTISDGIVARVAGAPIHDSQSGLRVYPLRLVEDVVCRAGHYAFETEVLIRSAWAGWSIAEVPIEVRYLPEAQRVSHFRPILDSWRWLRMMARVLLTSSRKIR